MEMALIQGVLQSSVKSKEKRSCAVPDEGCSGEFGLVLQSLMPLQVAYIGGASGTQGSEVPSSENLPSTNQVLLKATATVLKVPICLLGCQALGDAASHEFAEALQERIFPDDQTAPSLKQVYPMFEEVDGTGDVPDQDVSRLLHSANGTEKLKVFYGAKAQGQGLNVVYGMPAGDAKSAVKESQALGTSAYDDPLYIAEAVADIKDGMALKKDDDVKSSGLDSLESIASRYQGSSINVKTTVERVNAGPLASCVDAIQQGMHDDVAALDNVQDGSHFDLNDNQEGYTLERLYSVGQPLRMLNDEMSTVSGERPLNLHEALVEIADRVRVLLSCKRSEMEVSLKPPELGKMVVKVAMENGTLAVRITVESNAVKDFIQAHAQELKALLAQEGYNLADIDVNIGQGYQQPQRDDVGNGWRFENPIPRRARAGMAEIQHSTIRSAAYYDGHHRFDCLV